MMKRRWQRRRSFHASAAPPRRRKQRAHALATCRSSASCAALAKMHADALGKRREEARCRRRGPGCGRSHRRMILPGVGPAAGVQLEDLLSQLAGEDGIPRCDVRWRRYWARSAANAGQGRVATSRCKRDCADVLVRSIPRQAGTWQRRRWAQVVPARNRARVSPTLRNPREHRTRCGRSN